MLARIFADHDKQQAQCQPSPRTRKTAAKGKASVQRPRGAGHKPLIPMVLVGAVLAGIAYKAMRKHRSRASVVPRAEVHATAGAAAARRDQEYRARQNARAPRRSTPGTQGTSRSSNEGNTNPQLDVSGAPLNGTPVRHPRAGPPVQHSSAVGSSHTPQTKDAAAVDPQPPVAPDTEPSAPSAESKFEDDLEYALALSMQPNATTNVPPSHSRSSVLPEEGEGYSAEADAAERARRADRSQVAGAADLRAASRRGRSSSNRQQSGARGPEPSNQADASGAARHEEWDLWNPPTYQPEGPPQQDQRLYTWETADVMDMGRQPHPARAHLDSGNGGCTLINRRFAARLGLVDYDGRPTQAYTQTERATGVVYGAVTEHQIINIQYKIKGKTIHSKAGVSDQGPRGSWDLLISRKEIAVFESDGFQFTTR